RRAGRGQEQQQQGSGGGFNLMGKMKRSKKPTPLPGIIVTAEPPEKTLDVGGSGNAGDDDPKGTPPAKPGKKKSFGKPTLLVRKGGKKSPSTAKKAARGKGDKTGEDGGGNGDGDAEEEEDRYEQLLDAGETDGTADIPQEYRDEDGNFKRMPVPRHLGSLTRRRPPLVAVFGVAGCGKSRLASALMGRQREKEYRATFGVGSKTIEPKLVMGEELSVLDTPGLPDPQPRNSDTYYNDTVTKLRSVGYANAILFVVSQERVTPTLIKNYGLLYRALNRLDCVKMFVLRRETSYLLLNKADQEAHESESRRTVNQILDATNLKNFSKMQFFMLTNGSGEEQDKQVKNMREQVKRSPRVEVNATEGLRLTTEVKSDDLDGKGSDDGSSSNSSSNGSRRSSKRMSRTKGSFDSYRHSLYQQRTGKRVLAARERNPAAAMVPLSVFHRFDSREPVAEPLDDARDRAP
ncbi:unnamed protein product, partial [Ectocarpus sp. 12 AP-2014]